MTRTNWRCLIMTVLLASGCAASDESISGIRADGLAVNCVLTGDDVYACDPQDLNFDEAEDFDNPEAPDNADDADDADDTDDPGSCEDWEEGGEIYVLWPPNHKIHTFTLDDCATIQEDCDIAIDAAANGRITAVTSDEPDNGKGDGNTDGDIKIIDDVTVEVRSERQGGGDGRVYRIEYETDDDETGACEIHVPHSRGPYGGAEDSGEAARVESPAAE